MGSLYNNYCFSTSGDALNSAFGEANPVVIADIPYYPSYSGGGWILQGPGASMAIPSIGFPPCDPVGPYPDMGLNIDADFYSVIFWAVGISAAFMLFKRAIV